MGPYKLRKKFVTENPGDIQKANGVTSFDDPTYLGFDLSFIGDHGLMSTRDGEDTAYGYLLRVDPTRAGYLKAFVDGLKTVNTQRPYYWQTITGLGELWTKDIVSPLDPFVGSSEGEAGLTIGCLEAIDLKLTALFNLYRMACYDNRYRRYVVPENLRHFDMYVIVREVRHFKDVIRSTTDDLVVPTPNTSNGKLTQQDFLNSNQSFIMFKLEECEFSPTSGATVFDSVTNQSGEYSSTSMMVSYGNIVTIGDYSGLDYQLVGSNTTQIGIDQTVPREIRDPSKMEEQANIDAVQGRLDSLEPSVADGYKGGSETLPEVGGIKGFIAGQAGAIANAAVGLVKSFAQNIVLGRAHGLQGEIRGALTNPQALTNLAVGAAAQLAESQGTTIAGAIGERIHPDVNFQQVLSGDENILGFGPPGPGSLSSENIHGE